MMMIILMIIYGLKYYIYLNQIFQEEWSACQQTWIYLEVIFSAPDIQRQLPNETRLFSIVDKSWKDIMRKLAKVGLKYKCRRHDFRPLDKLNSFKLFKRFNGLI